MTKPIFVHVPKTAGSSIRTLITANYAPAELLNIYGGYAEVFAQFEHHMGKTADFKLIQGHLPYGTHRYLGEDAANYFCFLREPVARTLSDISFAQRSQEHGFHEVFAGADMSLGQHIRAAGNIPYYRNNMTQYISGMFFLQEISPVEYAQAVDNLKRSAFVGITEHFEESLLIMARRLGWRFIVPQLRNISSGDKVKPTAEDTSACKSFIGYDLALYDIALEIFHQDRLRYGELLAEAAQQMRSILEDQIKQSPNTVSKEYLVGTPLTSPLYMPASGTPLARWMAESAVNPT